MVKQFLFLLLTFSSLHYSEAQTTVESLKHQMRFYGDALMNMANADHRLEANERLTTAVDSFLAMHGSESIMLDDVPWLSVIESDTIPFRLITWQIKEADSIYKYGGRIQLKNGAVVPLRDNREAIGSEMRRFDASNWYGARYYDIKPFQYEGLNAYVLFGFDAFSAWENCKILDVLTFVDGNPVFGLPVFSDTIKDHQQIELSRLVLVYSANARVNLRYDNELEMIVYDHLMPMRSRMPGKDFTHVGDGTFVGYKMGHNGKWYYRERVFEDVPKEPLDDGKKELRSKQKDLFGRDRQ